MEAKSDESTLSDKVFVEQCDHVKQTYEHILTVEEKERLDHLLSLKAGERRLLFAMYFSISK